MTLFIWLVAYWLSGDMAYIYFGLGVGLERYLGGCKHDRGYFYNLGATTYTALKTAVLRKRYERNRRTLEELRG